jgi:gluconokinase
MSRHALVVMGAAGAGKSRIGAALAKALAVPFVEGDTFHSPENITRMKAGTPLTDDNRQGWLEALAQELHAAREASHGVVLTCSALKRRYRDLLRGGDPTVHFIFLDGSAALLRERLNARSGHYMPASLIESQLEALEPPHADEQAWTMSASAAPEAIVADVLQKLGAVGAP